MAAGHIEPVEERVGEMRLVQVEVRVRWPSKQIDLELVRCKSGRSVCDIHIPW